MNYKKYLFVFSSLFFLSHFANFIYATEENPNLLQGEILVEGNIIAPLKNFQPSLETQLAGFKSPVEIVESFQADSDKAGIFKPIGSRSYGALTTIDPAGYPVPRIVGITPLKDKDIFAFNTNPTSAKINQATVNNRVALHFAWHTERTSRQINFFGKIVPSSTSQLSSINIPLNGEEHYNSDWGNYFVLPISARVSQLTRHYKDGKVYAVVENVHYDKQTDGTWKISKKPLYIGQNKHLLSPEERASAKKNG
ncbi:MAG: hypothetical protein B7Y25_01515 [Alphaproteobacteria bacterium 16-39-46]|nr:MAG: hypothetical protein B7Y25_01515 [Alphaproteobacteria bacterium 16-39-46]OZA44094.1 MAG: hypothetical protein B7X84_01500 [Alphaproteobacteria bacterium 17-39-52]HQS83610.1 pyridoxamine 5'-phosphate oxidase family protein [Alphaproteobacteria bacterium]HQS93399.1 pyridoxamine 5'-phosphate oxidase family protein [Alphaproteobacteria bacterium]